MTQYLVVWEIELDAESPEDAAKQAREIQLDPANIADHFTVWEPETDEDWVEPRDVNVLELQ
jgi:hypothetical protein